MYTNYEQFIQTSKEITYLEAEMYKLGHLLTEQKALISSLTGRPCFEIENHFRIQYSNYVITIRLKIAQNFIIVK